MEIIWFFSSVYSLLLIEEQYSAIIPSEVFSPDDRDRYQLSSCGVFMQRLK